MMTPMIRRAWILAVALWLSAALHAQVHDFSYFARQMADPDWLTHVDYLATRLESSFDRTGGNNDGFNPERLKDNVYTIADLKGPGVVRRFYTAKDPACHTAPRTPEGCEDWSFYIFSRCSGGGEAFKGRIQGEWGQQLRVFGRFFAQERHEIEARRPFRLATPFGEGSVGLAAGGAES